MRLRPKPNSAPRDLAFGINPVAIALGRGLVRSLLHLEGSTNPRLQALVEAARAAAIPVHAVEQARLDQLTKGGVHQGIAARLRSLPLISVRDLPAGKAPALAVLADGVIDPQNLGSILRTAVALEVAVVVLRPRRGAPLTPGVHRASAGLSLCAPVAAQNLAAAARELKEQGYWLVASAVDGAEDATRFDWPARTALILGGEEKGVSRHLRDEADFTVTLPMGPQAESLNVGVAFGVLGYLWRKRWPGGRPTRDASTFPSRTAPSPPP